MTTPTIPVLTAREVREFWAARDPDARETQCAYPFACVLSIPLRAWMPEASRDGYWSVGVLPHDEQPMISVTWRGSFFRTPRDAPPPATANRSMTPQEVMVSRAFDQLGDVHYRPTNAEVVAMLDDLIAEQGGA